MKRKSIILTIFTLFFMSLLFTSCNNNNNTNKLENENIIVEGNFEEGLTLFTNKLETTSNDYTMAINKIANKENDKEKVAVFDIKLLKENNKIQPNGKVKITMPKPFETEYNYITYHIKDEEVEELVTTLIDNNITFETTSFSYFVVTATTTGSVIGPGGNITPNDPNKNFFAYADTESQGRIVVNKEEKASYVGKLKTGDEIYLSAIPFEGYEFVGWYKNSKLSHLNEKYDEYKDDALITFKGDKIEIYARFMPIEYKISYELVGGSLNEEAIYSYNIETNDITLPTPLKDYYSFTGWMKDEKIISTIKKGTTGDINLIATWNQTSGLPRFIEIIKEFNDEIEQGDENILLPSDYAVTVDDVVINGDDLKKEDGVVTIEYKEKDSNDEYSTNFPTKIGDYLIRVRISKSTTTPYYNEAISLPKEFKIIERELKTKFNVLGNYWYDRYKMGSDKITRYTYFDENLLELEDVLVGEDNIKGYQSTTMPLSNLMFYEWKEKYTEVRVGSKDGIAIGRIRVYGQYHVTVENYDDNGVFINSHDEYFTVSVQGQVVDKKFSKVIFELLPNIEGYTDSEGKWIYNGKSLDVCTFTHFLRDNFNETGVCLGVTFEDYAHNGYKDESPYYQYALYKIKNEAADYGFLCFTPSYNFKYDIEITGDVLIYRFDSRDNSTKLIPTKEFMTVSNERKDENDFNYYKYVFVVSGNQQVIIYNGKAFPLDKANVI